jgi:hypothetical protein
VTKRSAEVSEDQDVAIVVLTQILDAALPAASSTGSQTGENGGAFERSMPAASFTLILFQSGVASTSMRLPAPYAPTICAPSDRPVPRSATIRSGLYPMRHQAEHLRHSGRLSYAASGGQTGSRAHYLAGRSSAKLAT